LPETSENKKKVSFTSVISLMTLAVPILYLIGYYYSQGYLATFDVSDQYFPSSVQDYLVNSFFVFVQFIVGILAYANEKYYVFIGFAFGMFLLSLVMVVAYRYSHKIDKTKEILKNHPSFDYMVFPSFMFFLSLLIPYLAIFALALLVFIPIGAYWQGEKDANTAIEKFRGCELHQLEESDKCTFIEKDGVTLHSGMFIAKSSTHIALWDGKNTKIYPLKNELIVMKHGEKKSNN